MDFPTEEQLQVDTPPLEHLGPRDVLRLVHIVAALLFSVGFAVVARSWRRPRRAVAEVACDGLVDGLIRLGPTMVKVGQIVASSGTLFPPVLASAARRCLDEVTTFPAEHVRRAVEEDLGQPIEALFASFDDEPLSAASIGQVHACTLLDGRDAVVKVQRPGIRTRMAMDLRVGFKIARLLELTPWARRSNAREIIRDVHTTTFQELVPLREAWQQHRFREAIGAFGDNRLVTAPAVYWDYCGPQVICMERVYGTPMDAFDALAAKGFDGQTVLRRGAKVWAEAVMIHGPFHGDMHAGNIWALDDGRTCFLDFGIMGELPESWKQVMKDLFYTCSFDLDFVRIARSYRGVGAIPADVGTDEELGAVIEAIFGPLLTDGFGNLDIAAIVTQSLELLKLYDATVPRELVLIGKQLLYVDKFTTFLAPEYSLTADPYVVKNIFPAEAAARAAALEMTLDDDAVWVSPVKTAAVASSEPTSTPHDGGPLVTLPFLSPEWITAMRELRDELDLSLPPGVPAAVANITVTDVPFGNGTVEAHVDTTDGSVQMDLGYLRHAQIDVSIDHATARALVLDQQPQLAVRAFLTGKIKLTGNLEAVLGPDTDLMELLGALGATGTATVAELHPAAGSVGERVRSLTA
ncbi:MAG TPA: AarF/UbiB family protein [Acidimicrobiales bacterium]|jgi:predicted unusual protein kinase regulating ubiquinone biosynthesis (AarF/ABC1/UbiB family)|nr:AarF/UbiB family protein [Acidimicrobiales bacterium]